MDAGLGGWLLAWTLVMCGVHALRCVPLPSGRLAHGGRRGEAWLMHAAIVRAGLPSKPFVARPRQSERASQPERILALCMDTMVGSTPWRWMSGLCTLDVVR